MKTVMYLFIFVLTVIIAFTTTGQRIEDQRFSSSETDINTTGKCDVLFESQFDKDYAMLTKGQLLYGMFADK